MLQEAKQLVKQNREDKKLTQQQLADKLFVARTTISMIENDEKYVPSVSLAKSLGCFLNFDWTKFFE